MSQGQSFSSPGSPPLHEHLLTISGTTPPFLSSEVLTLRMVLLVL